ncbi:MAG: benzoyl-CoA 2,3-epoxidase subunit BoxB, partial [Aestuariivirgaceae bacterium]
LFGSEISTNAANSFHASVKGRFKENRLEDDHMLADATYPVTRLVDGEIKMSEEPALTALNARLRDDYIHDCGKGMALWNNTITRAGVDFRIELPNAAFNRHIGEFRDVGVNPAGELLSDAAWSAGRSGWLPSTEDGDYIQSLMTPVAEPGKFANWIAPPKVGINNQPGDFEYVKIDG